MPRIRTVKPEFWDSPSTAKAGPWARLCFIGMWNWADDYGRGTANLKELEGFIFPHDDTFTDRSGNTVHFRDVVAEVSECFGVVLYEVDGRPYYAIPTWDRHQRNERRAARSKHPGPEVNTALTSANTEGAEIPCISVTRERKSTDAPSTSGTGTGEQGNRGTGEQDASAEAEACPPTQLALVENPKRKAPSRPLPAAWEPNAAHQAKAAEHNIDLSREAEKFKGHALAHDRRVSKWDQAFHNWLNTGIAEGRATRFPQPAQPAIEKPFVPFLEHAKGEQ